MTTNLDMAQKLFGTESSSTSAYEASGYGVTSSVRYGTVTEVDGEDVTILMDDTDSELYLTTGTPVTAGDRVTVVLNGTTYLVYTMDTVESQIDEVAEAAKEAEEAAEEAAAEAAEKIAELEATVAANKEAVEEEVAALNETIASASETIDSIKEQVDALDEEGQAQLAALEETIAAIEATSQEISETVAANKAETAEEVAALQAAVEAAQTAADAAQTALDALEESVGESIDSLESKVHAVTNDVDTMSEQIDEQTVTIENLATTVAACVTSSELSETLESYSTTDQTAAAIEAAVNAALYDEDGNLIYATQSDLTVTATEIAAQIESALYDEDGDPIYATTSELTETASSITASVMAQVADEYATKSELSVTEEGILSTVAETYLTTDAAESTYATSTELTQTSTELSAEITTQVGELGAEYSTLIRATSAGVEVAKLEDGEYTGGRTQTTAEGFAVYDVDDNLLAALTGSGTTFYDGSADEVQTAYYGSDSFQIGSDEAAYMEGTSSGINLYNSSGAKRAAITSSGMTLYSGGSSYSYTTATFASDGIHLYYPGSTSKSRMAITSSYIYLYGTDGSTKRTSIGDSYVRLGTSGEESLYLNADGVALYDEAGDKAAGFTSDGVTLYDSGTETAAFTSDGVTLYDSGSTAATFTDSGVEFYNTDGDSTALFGDGSFQIGTDDAEHLIGSSGGVYVYNPSNIASAFFGSSSMRIYSPSSSTATGGIQLTSSQLNLYKPASSTVYMQIGSSYVKVGNTSLGGYSYISSSGFSVYDSSGHKQFLVDGSDVQVGRNGTSYNKVLIDESTVGVYVPQAPDDGYPFWVGTDYSDVGPGNTYFRVSSSGDVGVGSSLYVNEDLMFQAGTAGSSDVVTVRPLLEKTVTITFSKLTASTSYTTSSSVVTMEDDEPDDGYVFFAIAGWSGTTALRYGTFTRLYASASNNLVFTFRCDTAYSSSTSIEVYVMQGAKGFTHAYNYGE